MTTERREYLRRIMRLAWGLYRSDLDSTHPRTFSDARSGAWRWIRGEAARMVEAAAWARKIKARGGQLSPELIRSPIRRSLTGQGCVGARDYHAAYTTARLGR